MATTGRDAEASRTVVSLLRAGGLLSRVIERVLLPCGLTLPKFNVLMELAAAPEGTLPLYDLIGRLLSSPPNISALIARMEEDGLVAKERDPADARVVRARITEQGWERLGGAASAVFELEKALVSCLDRDALRALPDLVERISAEN